MSWEESSMVEWKKLGEVCTLKRGVRVVRKNLQESGPIPVFQNSLTPLGFFEKSNYPANIPFVICAGAAGEIGFSNGPFWAADDCTCILCKSSTINKFAYYYLLVKQHSLKSQVRKASVPRLSKNTIENFIIPIPSIAEQKRIVGILDTFTDSIENLKKQIEQRRKQYEFYRDQLLDLEGKDGVEMKKLEDIVSNDCSLSYGIVQPGDDVEGGVPVVRPVDLTSTYVYRDGLKRTESNISESYKRTILVGNEILFCVRGTTGIMGLATSDLKGCNVTRGIVPIKFDNEVLKKFVYYQMKSYRLQKLVEEKTNGTALKQINIKDLRLLTICLPPTSEQQRIVSILDTFEESIKNLEAQLEQRQKQYEYYRNKLLTFD